MNQPEILDSDIRALQQWLRAAWQQLGDPSLTAFARRELRNQMKQSNTDLRALLQQMAQQQPQPVQRQASTLTKPDLPKPDLRILAW